MRRCYHCGERLSWLNWPEGDEEAPTGPPRRDTVPHRGGVVMTLGILGLVFLPFCGLVGLGLSLCAWLMGRADLARMRDGAMDKEGEANCRVGVLCGMIGTPLNILWLLGCLTFWGLVLPEWEDPPPERQPRFGGPQPQQGKGKW
jgi:hypothetical protein